MRKLIILSLVLFPLLCFAADKSFDNYNAHRNANDKIFDEFFKEYGADIKVAAILSACDRKDLSSKYWFIRPTSTSEYEDGRVAV
jgi:hypothetical protein